MLCNVCTRLTLLCCYQSGKGYDNWVMPIGIVVWVVAGYFPHMLNVSVVHGLLLAILRNVSSNGSAATPLPSHDSHSPFRRSSMVRLPSGLLLSSIPISLQLAVNRLGSSCGGHIVYV
jgi:hypothetical protein